VIRSLLLLSSAFYFSSALDPCNFDLPGYDAGEDSSTSDATTTKETVGTQCTTIITAFCQQATGPCALQGFTLSDCVSSDMPECCSSGTTCEQDSTYSSADVSQCTSDISAEDCNSVTNSTLPSSCQSLLDP
jgi:hypothetical protein